MALETKLADILFHNTGSTTALLEAITGEKVQVEILQEGGYQNEKLSLEFSWSESLILRVTKLKIGTKTLSYNVVLYDPKKTALFQRELSYLNSPIGKLLEQIDSRRIVTCTSWRKPDEMNEFYPFGQLLREETYPTKTYHYLHDSKVLFYIFEIYNIKTLNQYFDAK